MFHSRHDLEQAHNDFPPTPLFHLVKDLNFQRLLIQYKKLVLYRERYQKDFYLDHYQIM